MSDIQGGSVVEGSDVFLVSGQTRSKCESDCAIKQIILTCSPLVYSSRQHIDDAVHGVTGSGIGTYTVHTENLPQVLTVYLSGAYIIIAENGYETSSGGPFFR